MSPAELRSAFSSPTNGHHPIQGYYPIDLKYPIDHTLDLLECLIIRGVLLPQYCQVLYYVLRLLLIESLHKRLIILLVALALPDLHLLLPQFLHIFLLLGDHLSYNLLEVRLLLQGLHVYEVVEDGVL